MKLMGNKKHIFAEITLTNNCNCNCSYCFEGLHICQPRNLDIEKRQLELLVDACKNFDKDKYESFIISFWGGEPFLNMEFMYEIIKSTCDFDFVKYHCYSNGILLNKYKELFSKDFFQKKKDKFHIQLSYDGEPHHSLKRGNNSSQVLTTAQFLYDNNIQFSFKATLSYDLLDKLPDIWDSYKQLSDRFGNIVSYFPTLDTSTSPSDETFEIWKRSILNIAKKEFQYIRKNGRPLWQWFSNGRKMNCALGNSIHMHNDGNIYICHGCPYLSNSKRFIIKNINEINSLYDVITEKFNLSLDEKCIKCGATHCSACHVTQLKDNEDIYKNWSSCRSNDQNKCKYYQWFGYISKLLKLVYIKANLL